jgi:hypothetical protein
MASKSIRALWAKVDPESDPEVLAAAGTMSSVGQAYKAGRIDAAEAKALQDSVEKRTMRYLDEQGYGDDDQGYGKH